jgi:hypothetical protein
MAHKNGQSNTTMERGKLATTVPQDTLAITLSSFDYEKHTAMMIGNAGSDEVSFIPEWFGCELSGPCQFKL